MRKFLSFLASLVMLTGVAFANNTASGGNTGSYPGYWVADSSLVVTLDSAYTLGSVTFSGLTLSADLDMDGNCVVLDSDADTSICADTDDQIDIELSGADDFQFTANTFTIQSGSSITDGTATWSAGSITGVKLGSLTTNGFVKTSGGDGTLSVDTSTYLTGGTLTDTKFCTYDSAGGEIDCNSDAGSFTDIDTDYGNQTVTSAWNFVPNGTGAFADYDLMIGDTTTPDYGAIEIGSIGIYSSSFSNANLNLDNALVFRNSAAIGVGNDPGLLYVFYDNTGNAIRFAIPESGAGLGTYNPRSSINAGPYTNTIGNDAVSCDQWTTYDSNIDCDTSSTGADEFVQDDLEVEGTIFAHESINFEGSTADGNQAILQVGADPGSDITISLPTSTGSLALAGANSDITSLTGLTTPLGAAYGGTGAANNAANTITFSGNYGLTFTLTNTTALTLPTSGTLATTSDLSSFITASSTDTLTNKTFNANGTGNSISNIDVADLADGTDGELITWDASGNAATVGAGTAGYVLTSNGAGAAPTFQATGSGPTFDVTAGDTITSNKVVGFRGTALLGGDFYPSNVGFGNVGYASDLNWQASDFSLSSSVVSIGRVKLNLKKTGSPTDNLIVRIETDSSGSPSGTLVDANATGTIDASTLTTSAAEYTIDFSGTFDLASSTTYWIVCRRSAGTSTSNYAMVGYGTKSGSTVKKYSPWSTSHTDSTLQFELAGASGDSSIYQVSSESVLNIVGFSIEGAVQSGTFAVQYSNVLDGFSGLTAGEQYYLNDDGAISTTPGATSYEVGIAMSSTELLIRIN